MKDLGRVNARCGSLWLKHRYPGHSTPPQTLIGQMG